MGADLFVGRPSAPDLFERKGGGLWRKARFGREERPVWSGGGGFGEGMERSGRLEREVGISWRDFWSRSLGRMAFRV